jgi:ABC-2 type transport system permease protein
MRALRTWRLVFVHEGRVLLADRTLWVAWGLFLLLVGFALFNGLEQARLKADALATVLAAQEKGEADRRQFLERIWAGEAVPGQFDNPADPSAMGGGYGARYAYMPISPLAPLAFGQSDLLADYYQVTTSSKIAFIDDMEIENPWNLLSGHFDMSFVVIYLLPLLIFAISYNFLSAEREQGTLRLLLSQPLGLSSLVTGKIAVRAVALLTAAAIVPLAALAAMSPDVRSALDFWTLASWAGIVIAYGVLWFTLAIAVNAFGLSSAANALILIGTWIVTVLVAPVLLNLAVSMASPAPSRTELATRTRLVTMAGLNRHAELLATDYNQDTSAPGLLVPKDGRIQVAARLRGNYLLERDVDRDLEALLESFRTQLAGQQRLVALYGWLSPAAVAYEGLTALAGTGLRRHLHFQRQIDDFHRVWRAFFEPRSLVRSGVLTALIQLLVPAAALLVLGLWRLRRYSVA